MIPSERKWKCYICKKIGTWEDALARWYTWEGTFNKRCCEDCWKGVCKKRQDNSAFIQYIKNGK